MIVNRLLRLLFVFLVLMLAFPCALMAQDESQPGPDDFAIQQDYPDGHGDSTRVRFSTNGEDFVYLDEQPLDSLVDSLPPTKNPKIAGWLSFAVPGAGQIYNGQYWKLPIIYGGLGTLIYVSQFYNTRYKQLKNDEHFLLGDSLSTGYNIFGLTNESDVSGYMLKYRRYRDLCFVGVALVYLMNIFDAVVDAHLYDYDISDDIALRVEPVATSPVLAFQKPAFGARIVLRF